MSGPRREILLSGLDDWVSLAEARSLVQESMPPSATLAAVRSGTLSALDDLLRRGLIQAGELRPRFIAWPGTPSEVLKRITDEWKEDDDLWVGKVCWLANSDEGRSLAGHLAERDDPAVDRP